MKKCKICPENLLCDDCDKLVNQKKKFSANLKDFKRHSPNEFGHMLPKCITTNMTFSI